LLFVFIGLAVKEIDLLLQVVKEELQEVGLEIGLGTLLSNLLDELRFVRLLGEYATVEYWLNWLELH